MSTSVAEEHVVWQGNPSQWLGTGTYAVSAVAAVLVAAALIWLTAYPPVGSAGWLGTVQVLLVILLLLPIGIAIRKYLQLRTTQYTVTSERIRIAQGIFSKRRDDMELYRVDDMIVEEPVLLRLVRRGNLVATSSDRTTPNLVLKAIPDVLGLRDQTRRFVEVCRDRKRTRVLDME